MPLTSGFMQSRSMTVPKLPMEDAYTVHVRRSLQCLLHCQTSGLKKRVPPSERYWGSCPGLMPRRAARPGSSRKTNPACAADPKEFTYRTQQHLTRYARFALANLQAHCGIFRTYKLTLAVRPGETRSMHVLLRLFFLCSGKPLSPQYIMPSSCESGIRH